jgi:hypothetical protein
VDEKLQFTWASIKDAQATEEAFSPPKENNQRFKT